MSIGAGPSATLGARPLLERGTLRHSVVLGTMLASMLAIGIDDLASASPRFGATHFTWPCKASSFSIAPSGPGSGTWIGLESDTIVVYQLTNGERIAPVGRIALPVGCGLAELADCDADGHLDAILSYPNTAPPSLRVLSTLDGTPELSAPVPVTAGVTAIATGDVTGDGVGDIVALSGYSWRLYVLERSPTGWRTSFVDTLPSEASSLAIGDMNGDQTADIVTGGTGTSTASTIQMLLSVGGRGLQLLRSYPAPYARRVICADMNDDGFRDVVYSSLSSLTKGTYIWLGDGAGRLAARARFPYVDVSGIADLDQDGRLDVMGPVWLPLTDYVDVISPAILYGRAGGTLSDLQTLPCPDGQSVLASLTDTDGDGLQDLVVLVADSPYQTFNVIPNRGSRRFGDAAVTLIGGSDLVSIRAVGDVNGDARPDLVGSQYSGSDEAYGHSLQAADGHPEAWATMCGVIQDWSQAIAPIQAGGALHAAIVWNDFENDEMPAGLYRMQPSACPQVAAIRPRLGPTYVYYGDVTGDGVADMILHTVCVDHECSGPDSLAVVVGTAAGPMPNDHAILIPASGYPTLVDFDGDNIRDIVMLRSGYVCSYHATPVPAVVESLHVGGSGYVAVGSFFDPNKSNLVFFDGVKPRFFERTAGGWVPLNSLPVPTIMGGIARDTDKNGLDELWFPTPGGLALGYTEWGDGQWNTVYVGSPGLGYVFADYDRDGLDDLVFIARTASGHAAVVARNLSAGGVGVGGSVPVPARDVTVTVFPVIAEESVEISWSKRTQPSEIAAFDLQGRRRRVWKSAVEGRVQWDRRDDDGHRLPSGVYFIRVRSGSDQGHARILFR